MLMLVLTINNSHNYILGDILYNSRPESPALSTSTDTLRLLAMLLTLHPGKV